MFSRRRHHGWLEGRGQRCLGGVYGDPGPAGAGARRGGCQGEPHHEVQQPDGTHAQVPLLLFVRLQEGV